MRVLKQQDADPQNEQQPPAAANVDAPPTKRKEMSDEQKAKYRAMVLRISEVFPMLTLDAVISAVLATRNEERAIDLLLSNMEHLKAQPQEQSQSQSIVGQPQPQSQPIIEQLQPQPQEPVEKDALQQQQQSLIQQDAQLKQNSVPQEEEEKFEQPVENLKEFVEVQKESQQNVQEVTVVPVKLEQESEPIVLDSNEHVSDSKKQRNLKQLKKFFPQYSLEQCQKALEQCKWNVDDSADHLLNSDGEIGEVDEAGSSADEESGLEDEEQTASSEDEEDTSSLISFDDVIEEVIADQQEWYKEALKQQNEFLSSIIEQDYKLALKLQEEEYMNPSPDVVDQIESSSSSSDDGKQTRKQLKRLRRLQAMEKDVKPEHNVQQPQSQFHPNYLSRSQYQDNVANLFAPVSNPRERFIPEEYWPDYKTLIERRFKSCSHAVTHVKDITKPSLLTRFINFWNQNPDSVCTLAFHGTSPHSVEGIISKGLLIPGKGNSLPVVNGSALGLGIYLALNPGISVSYSRGGNQMFCCAVLIGKRFHTTRSGDVLVAFHEEQVLPCWLVSFNNPQQPPQPQPRPRISAPKTSSSSAKANQKAVKPEKKKKKKRMKQKQFKK